MRNTFKLAGPGPQAKEKDCVHFWVIEFPEGPVSTGKCKNCGMERSFFNSLENIELQNDDRYKINRHN
jgi:hypothetical protein